MAGLTQNYWGRRGFFFFFEVSIYLNINHYWISSQRKVKYKTYRLSFMLSCSVSAVTCGRKSSCHTSWSRTGLANGCWRSSAVSVVMTTITGRWTNSSSNSICSTRNLSYQRSSSYSIKKVYNLFWVFSCICICIRCPSNNNSISVFSHYVSNIHWFV